MPEQNDAAVSARPVGGYGLWEATAETPDGRTVTAGGLSEGEASHRATLRAQAATPAEENSETWVKAPEAGFRPARVHFSAPVQAHLLEGWARIGRGGTLDFVPAGGEMVPGVVFQTYAPHRWHRVEWLVEEADRDA
jgi:hypothetical protein